MSSGQSEQVDIEVLEDTNEDWNVFVGDETLAMLQCVPDASRNTVRDEAIAILSKCVPPAIESGQTTGLVIGYVQSGKTLSFTTVTALARDNRFPMVVVIAGTSKPLTRQSHNRLQQDLRINERSDRQWRYLHNPSTNGTDQNRIESALDDWRDPEIRDCERSTVLITVMKQHNHLQNFATLLENINFDGIPVLIIDDEADQAGLNNLVNDGEESTTYRRLCTIKRRLPHHTFLQYTATPQGLLLINLIDVLSPSFAQTLTPGPDYVGGRDFFGENRPINLIRNIPTDEIPSANNVLTGASPSLVEAMRLFFVGVASGTLRGRNGNRSMMVHPARTTADHRDYHGWVDGVMIRWSQLLERPEDTDFLELRDEFQIAHEMLSSTVDDLEPFDELFPVLRRAIRRTVVHEVNARGGQTPEVNWRDEYSHILVGGQALDRGYTIEGLTISYMPRGVGAGRADTVQQRARFFGYKRPILGYCRIYLDPQVAVAFEGYVRHEEFIRDRIIELNEDGHPLSELRRWFLQPRGLTPTRPSIIDVSMVRIRLSREGWFTTRSPHLPDGVAAINRDVWNAFIEEIVFEEAEGNEIEGRTEMQKHDVAYDVSLFDVFEQLLLNLQYRSFWDAENFNGLLVLLQACLDQDPHTRCTIFKMSRGAVRNRRLNERDQIRKLMQGAYPDRHGAIYPGDRRVCHEGQISFQVHNLQLLDHETRESVHQNVPTLAVWIPEDLRGDVILQDQGGADEDDDD